MAMRATWGLFLLLPLLQGYKVLAQNKATIKVYEKSYPTYGFSDPSPMPLLNQVYPYFRYDGFTNKPIQKKWKVIELENDYIRLDILPEIGGKIWTAFDKKANCPFLYDNHAIKFRDIAMRGPWTSGGLESNFGIIGHTPNCATPVDYALEEGLDGSATCTIGALDLLTRSNWRLKIHLPKDGAFFTTEGLWYNPTEITQPYYHWMNAGIPVSGNLEYAFPGDSYIGHNGEYGTWPNNQENGKDISWYDNNDFGGAKSYHVFGKYTDFFGAYWHTTDFGMARYSLHSDKLGKKIWIWGLSRQGMIWENLLTDTDGQYSEIQSGRLYNQTSGPSAYTPFKHFGLSPDQTDTWKEYWYPVHSTQGITEANAHGAFNFTYDKGKWAIHFSPVKSINDTLTIKDNGNILFQKAIHLTPLETFSDSFTFNQRKNLIIFIGTQSFAATLKNQQPTVQRPKDIAAKIDWNSAYGLYTLGRNAIYEKEFNNARKWLGQALEKDSNFLPALNALAELHYRSTDYNDATSLLRRALQINTYDGEANYLWGITQLAQGDTVDAMDGLDVASLTPGFRTKAFTEMAKIQLKRKQLAEARSFLEKAVSNNTNNIEALQLLVTTARLQQNKSVFEKEKQHLLALDPLNHFARFEDLRYHPHEILDNAFTRNIQNEMPNETYLEMAIFYAGLGLFPDAEDLLQRCSNNPEAQYWLAYIHNDKVDLSKLNMNFSFPFRTETAKVLRFLLQKQTSWQLQYSLALIEHNLGHIVTSQTLLKNCKMQPNIAAFYGVRALIGIDTLLSNKETDLQKAIAIDGNWRYLKLLTEFYYDKREVVKGLDIVATYYKTHPTDYIMGMLYAKGLILHQDYKICDQILTHIQVLPYEGATNGHELYREAKLMQAVHAIRQKKAKLATDYIQQARLWPENLGVGKPYAEDIDSRLEDWLEYQNQLQNYHIKDTATLRRIIAFVPKTSNTLRNFNMTNNLITAWAMQLLKNKTSAQQWLAELRKGYPEDKELLLVIDSFQSGLTNSLPTATNLSANVLNALCQ